MGRNEKWPPRLQGAWDNDHMVSSQTLHVSLLYLLVVLLTGRCTGPDPAMRCVHMQGHLSFAEKSCIGIYAADDAGTRAASPAAGAWGPIFCHGWHVHL